MTKDHLSNRETEDKGLLDKIEQYLLESSCVYSYQDITFYLKGDGELVGKIRVHQTR